MKQFSRFVSGFVVGVVCVALGAGALHSTLWAKGQVPSIAVDNTPINRSTSGLTSFAPVVKRAAPSVVNIYSTRVLHYHQSNPFLNPYLQQFFGSPGPREFTRREQVLGSGVIITPGVTSSRPVMSSPMRRKSKSPSPAIKVNIRPGSSDRIPIPMSRCSRSMQTTCLL